MRGVHRLAFCAGLLSVSAAPGAFAQPQDAQDAVREEIIVTARRRAESIQDVPIAVSVLSGAEIEARGIADIRQLQYQTPSLTITSNSSTRESVSFAIRGQRTNEAQLLTDPPIGTYFGEVVQPRTFGFGATLYDLESVQVLKGVQGTLFGRNMTGGAVLVEPRHPKLDMYEGEIRAQAGNYDLWGVYVMANIPIVRDKFAIRLNGEIKKRDGYTVNSVTGRDYDNLDNQSWRVSAKLAPNDNLTSVVIHDYLNSNTNGPGMLLTNINQTPGFGVVPQGRLVSFYSPAFGMPDLAAAFAQAQALGPRRTLGSELDSGNVFGNPFPGQQQYSSMQNWGILNKTTYEWGNITLKNILGFRHLGYSRLQDFDNVPIDLIVANQFIYANQWSEEFQVQGRSFDDRLQWTTGVYYFREKGVDGSINSQFPDVARLFGATTASDANQRAKQPGSGTAQTYAIYGAGTFDLTDRWKLSGGLRWTHDQRDVVVQQFNVATGACLMTLNSGAPLPGPCALSNSNAWRAVTWDVSLQFQPTPETNLYVAQRKGFRAGGFSLRSTTPAQLQPFAPEYVQETEFGAKKRWDLGGDVRLSTDAALFYQNYTNKQTQFPTTISGRVQTIIFNTASQKNYGGEIDVGLNLPFGLDITGFYSFVNVADVQGSNGAFALVGVPKHSLGMNAAYTVPLDESIGEVTLSGDVSYRSHLHLDDFDVSADQDGYALANIRLEWRDIFGTKLGIAAFCTNLFDRLYRSGVISLDDNGTGVGTTTSFYGEPRMYGGQISYKF